MDKYIELKVVDINIDPVTNDDDPEMCDYWYEETVIEELFIDRQKEDASGILDPKAATNETVLKHLGTIADDSVAAP